MSGASSASQAADRLPRTVILLGGVSLFMDISSEVIHSLLPSFLVTVLGVSALSVGLIEGIAEATASISKMFSGVVSDWAQKRKLLILLGYGLSALTKPLFPLASGLGLILVARFVDRLGKGIRGAPRDALIADVTPPRLRGAAFGLRQSMDTVGALVGPLLAMLLMSLSGGNFQLVFWAAFLPALISVSLILLVSEPAFPQTGEPKRFPIRRSELARFPAAFWVTVAIAAILTLARFSEAFLLLAAQDVGMALALVPGVLAAMNLVYALSAYPFGWAADRLSKPLLLAIGILILIAADTTLALAHGPWQVLCGALLWGLHMGATQGLLSVLVVDAAPAHLRGTAFGLFNLGSGLALLAASLIAGALWSAIGPAATFAAGGALASVALLGIALRLGSR
jgi:MFS family permease